jgi:hypothetical protein
MRKTLLALALGALAASSEAFMPSVAAPGLRARSPILSSPTRAGALPRFSASRQAASRILLMSGSEFTVGVLGDLHLDPRKMEDYETGKSQWLPTLNSAKEKHGNVALVSLGDLGESKSVRPAETDELFAGTTECHQLAAKYLGSFGVPYEVIGGNHDLEGLDEFDTDEANLEVFLRLAHRRRTCLALVAARIQPGQSRRQAEFSHPARRRLSDAGTPCLWQGARQAHPAVHAQDCG